MPPKFNYLTIQIHPKCNHKEFNKTCIYCASAQVKYKELVKMVEDTLNPFEITKLQITDTYNSAEE